MNIETAEKELTKTNEVRDKLLSEKRLVIRKCALGIRAVHTEDYGKAHEQLKEAKKMMGKLEEKTKKHPELTGTLNTPYQEIVELEVLLGVIENGEIPEVDAPPDAYLTGVLDAIGEMKRVVISYLMKGEDEKASELYDKMEETYYSMEGFAFPNSLVNGFKHKQDIMKRVLERLYETLAETKIRDRKH